MLLSITAN
jgi:hypothetical protein